jgi:hypothetical protein
MNEDIQCLIIYKTFYETICEGKDIDVMEEKDI